MLQVSVVGRLDGKQNDCKRKMKFDPVEVLVEITNKINILLSDSKKKSRTTDEIKRRWQDKR